MPINPHFSLIINPGISPGYYALIAGVFAILLLLIALIESVVLQLLQWGDSGKTLRASLLMNLISMLVGFAIIAYLPQWGLWSTLLSWGFSVIIDALILTTLNRGLGRQNWVYALLANLASYLILILPAIRYALPT